MTVEPTRLTLIEGDNGTVKCSVHSSSRLVTIEWYFQNGVFNQLLDGFNYVIRNYRGESYFIEITKKIVGATFSADHGSYYCRASARGEQRTALFFVDVQCK